MRRRNGTERYSVATYDYHLEDGTLAYQVVRYEPKDFRQRRPDGAGGWVWNMAGIRRVPYRLPQLRGAPVVFITEGEKDADALVALGLTATTNTGGAGKWTAADTAALITAGVGAVVVVPDNDPAGEAHAAKVAASCRGAGLEVRIVQLPELGPKEDVSDWLRAPGHTRETIEALVAATAPDHGSTGPAEADAEGASAGTEGEAEPLSDAGNARRFAREHGQDVRYCYALRAWFNWNALRWARDPGEQVAQRAKATARRGLMEALALPEGSARKAAVRHALYTESARGIRAMLELAQSEPGLSIAPEMLDADPWLLTTPAGTLELGAVPRCRPPRREDYITKITAAPYVPGARHPVFDRFLTEMLPDVASRAYVQRAAGYSLTASQAEEVLFLIRGRTAAGKTTLQEALKAALGDYAMAADFETFTAHKDRHGPREDLVRLKGARLVVTSETRERRLDEGMVKRATGGDTLAGRRLFENTVEFTSTFKLWLAGNHRPVVSGDDDAIWRRIREIPFPRSLSPAERDPTVKATLTDPAVGGPAVLAWAVEGCAAWCQRRAAKDPAGALGEPAAVVEATADYREVMDTVAAFLAACCVLESGAWVSRHDLREALEQWGREEGLSGLPSGRTLASGLRERGVLDKGREGRRGWRGVRLRGPADPEPETAEPSETVAPW
jgi:putative DNA primase/helicase